MVNFQNLQNCQDKGHILQSIFHYTQYRQYLSDYYAWAKVNVRGFSHRAFLAKAGMSGPNYLKKVMEGYHNLTLNSLPKFIQALGLNGDDAEYFECLVQFNQAKSLEEKDSFFEKLINLKSKNDKVVLEQSQYHYYKDWWVVAIRELMAFFPYHERAEELHQYLVPAITPKQAERAIVLLESLGLIEKTSEGGYRQTSQSLSTDPNMHSLLIEKFHLATARLGLEAMTRFTEDERRMSSVTMSIDESTFDQIVVKIREFRKQIAAIAAEVKESDRVIQLNMQMFPLSRTKPRQHRKRRKNGEE